jgi:hypothetical protein
MPAGVQVLDDFETGNGRFGSSLTLSPYSTGFASATVLRTAEESYTKSYSQKLSVVDNVGNTTPWRLRHLSGVATPNNNVPLPISAAADGFVGIMLMTTTPGMSLQLVLDSTNPSTLNGLRASTSQSIISDGEWHLYQWSLDAGDWGPFPSVAGSIGALPNGTAWINSLLIQGVNLDADIYFDSVMYNPLGSLIAMTLPPGSPVSVIPGDFDNDGDVDGGDFVIWQANFPKANSATRAMGDADGDGDVDGADFVVWQTNYPTSAVPALVPEPPTVWMAIFTIGIFAAANRFRAVVSV